MGITKHIFYRTSFLEHEKKVQEIFNSFFEKGDIYLGKYSGSYCLPCEEYVTKEKKKCPVCFSLVKEVREEETFFFRVTKYYKQIRELHEQGELLLPETVKNNLLNSFLNEDLRDFCVTRSNKKDTAGIVINIEGKE